VADVLTETAARSVLRACLARSWAARPKQWCRAVVVLEPGKPPRVVPRSEHAARLRADDLPELARECIETRVRPGAVLTYAVLDDGTDLSGVGFSVVALESR
jgi:hypothetical protein